MWHDNREWGANNMVGLEAFLSTGVAVLAVAFLFGYLLGSIPFGLVFTRMAGLGDIRAIGSGNIGTTNVLRTGSKKLATATLIADMLKATFPVLLARNFLGESAAIAAGLGAFIGHLYPIWLKFKGGKGVATMIGVLLGLYWPLAVLFALVWLYIAAFTRYSSFSALSASLAAPFLPLAQGKMELTLAVIVLSLLVWWRHHDNIRRLLKGEESRIGQKQ